LEHEGPATPAGPSGLAGVRSEPALDRGLLGAPEALRGAYCRIEGKGVGGVQFAPDADAGG